VATDPNDIPSALTTPILRAQRAFSIEQFCKRYGVGRTKAYEELKLGRLQARKIGRHTIIPEDDAEAWLRRLPRMKSP
jgi:excisionase family DNA binding protein